MKRTTITTGLLVVALAITAAVFGGLAAASTQKVTHSQPLGVAVHGSSGVPGPTVASYMAAVQKQIPDPTAVTPAKIRSVATSTAKHMGVYSASNFTITIKCSWPPINCQVIITL